MRILLVCKSKVMENLGVMYLSAVIKQEGHRCMIIDFANAEEMAKTWMPDVIGYSVMTGDQWKFVELNWRIKSAWPSGKKQPISIMGGPHPTFFRKDFMNGDGGINSSALQAVDMVVPGEAEQWMANFLESGRTFDHIDTLPNPDRTDFPDMKIRDFITTRGCPHNCSYCYNEKWAELFPEMPRVRTRSVESVIPEIIDAQPEFVYFQDSCFALSMEWLREFTPAYKRHIHKPFHCHLRPTQVNEERVDLLAEAGCVSVRIALESASERLRHMMNRKNVRHEDVLRAVRLLKGWEIKLMIQNIIGMPTATIQEDLETLEFNIRCKPAYAWVSIFMPYPGTKLGDYCKEEGWYDGDYSDLSDNFFDTSYLNFDPDYIEHLECLQKVFALCVEAQYLPHVNELTHKNLPKLVHKIMRGTGDKRLYCGIL